MFLFSFFVVFCVFVLLCLFAAVGVSARTILPSRVSRLSFSVGVVSGVLSVLGTHTLSAYSGAVFRFVVRGPVWSSFMCFLKSLLRWFVFEHFDVGSVCDLVLYLD